MSDYALFQSSLPRVVHRSLLSRMQRDHMDEGVPHDAVPAGILLDPLVLHHARNLLGETAKPDSCRHVHLNEGSEHGPWHVDDYCGEPWPEGQFAILCYFPQDTPPELGPTAIRVNGREIAGSGPAGTCLLMRHNVEHRATANTAGQQRYMLKYLFRDHEPR